MQFQAIILISVRIGKPVLLVMMINTESFGQSCSSGGVPISNNLGLPISDVKTWQFALSYDRNILKTLKQGSEKLEDDARERLTHSILFQSGYVINDRWSAEVFVSWIRQERIITQFGNVNTTTTSVFGDALILANYKILSNSQKRLAWIVCMGSKLPTGASDRKDENRIQLNADLQPGSDTLDLITWTLFSGASQVRPSLNYSASATFSLKGKNNNYLGSQVYQFGDELILIGGLSDLYAAGILLWGASLEGMIRVAGQDENNGEKNPGTGGRWVFIRPAVLVKPKGSSSVNSSTTIPLYSHVLDAQLTPTIRYNLGIYYDIRPRPSFK